VGTIFFCRADFWGCFTVDFSQKKTRRFAPFLQKKTIFLRNFPLKKTVLVTAGK